MRAKLGWEHHLLHDVHHRLTPIEAARLGKDLEPYRLFWMEDATPAENQEAFRLIRQHTTTPLAVGEVFNTLWDCKDLIAEQLIDYIRSTVVHAGGITHLQRIADFAAHAPGAHRRHGATDLSPVCMGAALHFDLCGAELRHPGAHAAQRRDRRRVSTCIFLQRRFHAPGRGAGSRRDDRRSPGGPVSRTGAPTCR